MTDELVIDNDVEVRRFRFNVIAARVAPQFNQAIPYKREPSSEPNQTIMIAIISEPKFDEQFLNVPCAVVRATGMIAPGPIASPVEIFTYRGDSHATELFGYWPLSGIYPNFLRQCRGFEIERHRYFKMLIPAVCFAESVYTGNREAATVHMRRKSMNDAWRAQLLIR